MNKKYEILADGRVRALKDFGDVKAGDIGGFVESESNLSQKGLCWVSDDAYVSDDARVYDYAQVSGDAKVSGDALVYGNAWVYGNAHVFGNAKVYGFARVYGFAKVYGFAEVYGNAHVFGDAKVSGNAQVSGDALVYGNAHVDQKMHIISGIINATPDIKTLLATSIGVLPINGVVRLYKRICSDMSSDYDPGFIYPESGVVECEDYDDDISKSCAAGLHFSKVNYGEWAITPGTDEHVILVADINVEDIICVQAGKVRCKRATIIGIADSL